MSALPARAWPPAAAVSFALALGVSACDGAGRPASTTRSPAPAPPAHRSAHRRAAAANRASAPTRRRSTGPPYPRLLPAAQAAGATGFVPAVSWHGQTAAWVARTGAATLLSFDQRWASLQLHSGTIDAGATGWRYGPEIPRPEQRRLMAAVNGGFKLSTGAGGFVSGGRVAVALRTGLGSIVTYTDGTTDIGSWRREVPAPSKRVASVRQNLPLLIDGGRPAGEIGCLTCWGATLGGVADPARSALGITRDGRIVWAGGEHLTPTALAETLLGAHVLRAVELDINPEWVAGYLYGHRGGHGPLAPVPMAPGQPGVPGQFLAPYGRDFFAFVAR